MFSQDKENVLLLRKNRPAEQEGLLNGIGGKVNPGERIWTAMRREFFEETGKDETWWEYCGYFMREDKYIVHLFITDGDIYCTDHKTDEGTLEIHNVEALLKRGDTMPNLKWLIPMALAPDKPFIRAVEHDRKRSNERRITNIA